MFYGLFPYFSTPVSTTTGKCVIAFFLIRRLQVQVLSGVLDIKSIISSVCGTYEFQLYGLLKLITHCNYDVWRGEVTDAKTEESVPEELSGQKSILFVV